MLRQTLQHREGGWRGPGPSPGLGWGGLPGRRGRFPAGPGQARQGVPGQSRAEPGCALGLWEPLRLLGMLPSHSLLSVPIQKETSKRPKQRKCQHRANQANSRGEQPWAREVPAKTTPGPTCPPPRHVLPIHSLCFLCQQFGTCARLHSTRGCSK